ncbi:MAG: response regulator [Alphaproteobacteria bacterium]|nr:response regulator [Alphaproteobacteria bacterium]
MIAEPMPGRGKPMRPAIVVAEDNTMLRHYFVDVFESEGYEVLPACDGLDAFELLLDRRDASILVTDIDMPRMDGLTLAERARERLRDIDVLYVSGRDRSDIDCRGVPGSMFVRKPCMPDTLRQALLALRGDLELVA